MRRYYVSRRFNLVSLFENLASMVTLIQFIFFAINIAIGKYQAYRFDKDQKRINHTVWASYYSATCFAPWWFTRNWLLLAALLVMHLPLFNTALNYFRIPRRPLFYTHPEDPQGSAIDKLWGNSYPYIFFITIIIYIILQFFIYG